MVCGKWEKAMERTAEYLAIWIESASSCCGVNLICTVGAYIELN